MFRFLGTCFAGLLVIGGLLSDAQEPNWVSKLPASSPTPRASASMAYDAGREQVVLFGGRANSYNSDTWVWDGANWMQKNPATSPAPRGYHSMAYDAARGQVVLFGGYDGTYPGPGYRNDTWVWDGTNWTQKSPANSPPPRGYHSMAYDASRGQVVLFGGYDGSYRNDTWVWDGTNWTQKIPANSPTHGVSSAMVYDAARGQVVLFGGYDGSLYSSTTWAWDGINWTQKIPASNPPARASHAMAYDVTVGRVVLFGGYGDGGSSYRNDTWVWDGVSWAQKNPTNSPTPRIYPSLSYDERRGQVVLFGGDDSGGGSVYRNDTWLWAVSAVPYSITDAGQVSGLRFTYPSPGQNVFICVYFSGLSSWGVPVSHLLVGGSTASADTQGYMDFNAFMEQYVWTANTNGTYVVGAYETHASCSSDTAAVGYAAFYRTADNNSYGTVGHWSVLPVSTDASGSISVTTNLATASFTITGPANYSGSGTSFTQTNAPAGTYRITYGAVTGYSTPASETKTLAAGGSVAFDGKYKPALRASPSTLSFTYQQGVAGPPQVQTIALSSTGAALSFNATPTTGTGGNWLSVSPAGGTTPGVLSVSVGQGLTAGTYVGSIQVTSSAASNSPQTVTVTLTVTPPSSPVANGKGYVVFIDGVNIRTVINPAIPPLYTQYLYDAVGCDSNSNSDYWCEMIQSRVGQAGSFPWSRNVYDTDKAVRELSLVLEGFTKLSQKNQAPLVVVAHSWGTVLAYIAISGNKNVEVTKFVTIGSPLNAQNATVKDFTREALERWRIKDLVALNNVKMWANYWGRCDPISGAIDAVKKQNVEVNTDWRDAWSTCHESYYNDDAVWQDVLLYVYLTK